MWFRSHTIDKEQIAKLEKRVSELEKDIIDVLAQQKAIRDKVLRRFRGEIGKDLEPETESIKSFNPFKV